MEVTGHRKVIVQTMTLDMSVDEFNETAVVLELAALYVIPPSLISLNASG